MKHLFSLASLLFLVAFACQAQTLTYKLEKEGQRIVAIDAGGNPISVDYAQVLNLTGKKKLGLNGMEYQESTKEQIFNNAITNSDNTLFPVLTYSDNQKKLSVVEVNNKGKITGGLKTITQDNFPYKGASITGSKEGLFQSNDKHLLMKLTCIGFNDEKKPTKEVITVFDETLKILWHRELELGTNANDLIIENAAITNSGKAVLTGHAYQTLKQKSYEEKVFVITKDDTKKGIFFTSTENLITSTAISVVDDDKVAIGGLYETVTNLRNKLENFLTGTYIFEFDINKCVLLKSESYAFDSKTIKADPYFEKKLPQGLRDFNTANLFDLGADGFVLVTSKNLKITESRGGPIVDYYSTPQKLLVKFDKELHKNAEFFCGGTAFQSNLSISLFKAFKVDDNILLVFNDYDKKYKPVCKVVLVSASGEALINESIYPDDKSYVLNPALVRQISTDSFVLNFGHTNALSGFSDNKFQEAVISIHKTGGH